MSNFERTDFLVVGSGIAGLYLAYRLSDLGNVTIITKKSDFESNSNYAQGGIASVLDPLDTVEEHIQDTLEAGAGLCDLDAVRVLVEEGPDLVRELASLGVPFNRDEKGNFDLSREGGHHKNRIVHVQDKTGKEVENTLLKIVESRPNVRILQHHTLVDLITPHHWKSNGLKCFGAYVLDNNTGAIDPILSRKTVLATGGAGQVYSYTTNPTIATGDGVASAYRAGAIIKNMEFYQFHPTALFHPEGNSFLISEAVRGKGGILRNLDGEAFMIKYHEMKELAPRDIVARAIDAEMKRRGETHVLLDITHLPAESTKSSFPSIYQRCKELGIDFTSDPIPVVPAAHYMCGGVATDLHGRTNIENLYASGETTCTGVHGGNRLASNSLLECLVFSNRIAKDAQLNPGEFDSEYDKVPSWNNDGLHNTEEWVLISHDLQEIRAIMSNYVGIVRSNLRLERAKRRIDLILTEIIEFYNRTFISAPLLELRNIARVADLIIRSAILRKESRGLHFNTDYPENRNPSRIDTILHR